VPEKKAAEDIITRVSFGIGILLIPIALIAVMDIFGTLAKSGWPTTAGEWVAVATIVSVFGGTAAGLTARTHHSKRRKLIHLLITANAAVWLVAMTLAGAVAAVNF